MDAEQRVAGETRAGAAVGGRAGTGTGLASEGIPRLDLADGLAAGAFWGEHLREEGPEGQALGKETAAAVSAACGGLQQSGRHPGRADLAELAQRGLFEGLRLDAQLVLGRARGAAEEQTMETGEKRGCISHV